MYLDNIIDNIDSTTDNNLSNEAKEKCYMQQSDEQIIIWCQCQSFFSRGGSAIWNIMVAKGAEMIGGGGDCSLRSRN